MLGTLVLASVFSLGLCVGGYKEVSPNEYQQYETLLATAFAKDNTYNDEHNCITTKIETQVVAGLNIRYTQSCHQMTCTTVVYQVVWQNVLDITSHTCTSAHKRIPGGYSIVTDQTSVTEYETMLTDLQSSNQLTLGQYSVQQIQTQVVAGLNIKYSLLEGTTPCEIIVWDVPWMHQRTITKNTCTSSKRQLLGGFNPVDASNPQVQKCISKSLDRINAMSNSMFLLVNSQVLKAEQQVVAGMNYAVTFSTMPTTCMKGDMTGKTLADCPLDTNSIMTPNTWSVRCFEGLDNTFSVSNMHMAEDEEPQTPNDSDNGNDKPVDIKVHARMMQSKDSAKDKVQLKVPLGKKLQGMKTPVLSVVRRKRDINFLIKSLNKVANNKELKDLVGQGKKLLGGGDNHDLVNHVKDLLGKDRHDLIDHGKKLLGKDGHDLVNHVNNLLGGDDHDLIKHGTKSLLGQDGHDLVNHVDNLLGQDGHDMIKHGQSLLGGDGHDLKTHGKNLLGGDDHDYQNHGQKLLGGDGHDYQIHGQQNLGGDDHDYQNHGRKLLGGDGHDYQIHGQQNLGGDDHDYCHMGMFKDFQAKFNKLYGSAKEEEKRFMTFCDNMRMARKLQETEKGTAVYGATKFADLTKEEFQQYVGKQWDLNANKDMKKAKIPQGNFPESFDWRDHGAVTPVKNQGSCGSCWAFSTTGNIEGQWAIKKKMLVSLSEQELVDCDKLDEGCNGGLPSNAYKEIERLGGLETETEYAYKGEDEKCLFNKTEVKVFINDSVSISSDEDEMASWLAANGPISIGINAFAMQFYMGGISHPWKIFCNPKSLDHGVLIVGYGVQGSKPYWIVKNSWGPDWGEKGYYLVYRGDGVCGLNTMCTSAVVD